MALEPGTDDIEVAVTAGTPSSPATDEATFRVDDLEVPGAVVLAAPASVGGGNGPGTYAYPTATSNGTAVFAPGSFRLGGLEVIDSGSTVSFQVRIANLQPTFGSLLGAQLIDLYIHAPTGEVAGGEQRSAAAGAWNYAIAPADAWNQLIEVDGFGTDDWVTPSSRTGGLSGAVDIGHPQVSAAQLPAQGGDTPGVVTINLPTATLGRPGPGWTFTVTLAGQDGFGIDDARTFTTTPGSYTFGVCSAAEVAESPEPAICQLSTLPTPRSFSTRSLPRRSRCVASSTPSTPSTTPGVSPSKGSPCRLQGPSNVPRRVQSLGLNPRRELHPCGDPLADGPRQGAVVLVPQRGAVRPDHDGAEAHQAHTKIIPKCSASSAAVSSWRTHAHELGPDESRHFWCPVDAAHFAGQSRETIVR